MTQEGDVDTSALHMAATASMRPKAPARVLHGHTHAPHKVRSPWNKAQQGVTMMPDRA